MPAPIITITDPTDTSVQSSWAVGTVKASTDSAELNVHVWNNKGGESAVSDMIECTVGVFDANGLANDPIAANKWVNASINGANYTAIGGSVTAPLYAANADPSAFVGDAATEHVLSGAINDGSSATSASKANYADCKFKVVVPANASPGTVSFKIRFQGYYV